MSKFRATLTIVWEQKDADRFDAQGFIDDVKEITIKGKKCKVTGIGYVEGLSK